MASPVHPSVAELANAGVVRLAELGKQLLYLRQNHQPTQGVALALIDLRQKLEALALTTDLSELAILKGDLQETYSLGAVYTDPLLRPLLPDISAGGARVQRRVLGFYGRATAYANHLIGTGAILAAAS